MIDTTARETTTTRSQRPTLQRRIRTVRDHQHHNRTCHRPLPHPEPALDAATLTASLTGLLNSLRAVVHEVGRLDEVGAFGTQGRWERSTSTPTRAGER